MHQHPTGENFHDYFTFSKWLGNNLRSPAQGRCTRKGR
jgi:hypothetical protein